MLPGIFTFTFSRFFRLNHNERPLSGFIVEYNDVRETRLFIFADQDGKLDIDHFRRIAVLGKHFVIGIQPDFFLGMAFPCLTLLA